jgi:hypothetical protein
LVEEGAGWFGTQCALNQSVWGDTEKTIKIKALSAKKEIHHVSSEKVIGQPQVNSEDPEGREKH